MDKQQFDQLFNPMHSAGNVVQVNAELWILVQAIQEISAKRILELGTANGGTLKFFEHVAAPDGKIVTIDGGKSNLAHLPIDFSNPLCEITLISGNTQHPETVEEVKRIFGDEPIDFLFIDADHQYEGVKKDWENYHDLVRPGGIIGFHDVNHPPVKQLWNEINIPHQSKVHHNHGLGTGIIKL